MSVREPTRDDLIAARQLDDLETAVARGKLERTKARSRDPLVLPDAPQTKFSFQDMLDVQIPEKVAPKKPNIASKVSSALPIDTQLGVSRLLQDRPEIRDSLAPATSVQKALTRLGTEVAIESAALARFGPPGAAVGATTAFIRRLPATGRALAVSFPKSARALESAQVAAPAGAVAHLITSGLDSDQDASIGGAVTTGMTAAAAEALVPSFARGLARLAEGGYALKKGAREVVEKLVAEGQTVSPGFFSDVRAIQLLDNVASGSFFGGGRMKRAQLGGAAVLQQSADDFVTALRTVAADSDDVAKMTRQALQGGNDAWRLVARKKFGIIDEITKEGARVDVTSLLPSLRRTLREAGGEDKAGPLISEINRLREVGSINLDGTMSFEGAADLRSWLLSLSRGGDELVGGARKRAGQDLAAKMDRAMEDSFRGMLPKSGLPVAELKRAWRDANEFWKVGLEDWNSALVKSLAKKEPRQVALAIRRSTTNIKRVKRLLTGDQAHGIANEVITDSGLTGKGVWNEIQGEILTDMASKSMSALGAEEVFMGSKMLRKLRANSEQMTELLGKEGYDNATKIFEQLHIAQGGAIEKGLPGKVFITFQQAGAISEISGMVLGVGKGLSIDALGFLVGPAAVAKLFTSKVFTKWALLGFDPKTPPIKATRAITQMIAMAIKEGATQVEVEKSPEEMARSRRPIPAFFPATLTGPR